MKNLPLLLAILFCMLLSTGNTLAKAPVQAPADDQPVWSVVITVRSGQDALLVLPLNTSSTGFRWELEELRADTPIKLAQHRLLMPAGEHMAGAGGAEEWRFSTIKPGIAIVRAAYLRPWIKISTKPARTAVAKIIITQP